MALYPHSLRVDKYAIENILDSIHMIMFSPLAGQHVCVCPIAKKMKRNNQPANNKINARKPKKLKLTINSIEMFV